jgi:hypothetical protein
LTQWVLDNHVAQVPAPASDFGPELTESVLKMYEWDHLTAQAMLLLVPKSDSLKSEVEHAATKLAETFKGESDLAVSLGATLADHLWMNLQRSVPALRPASL